MSYEDKALAHHEAAHAVAAVRFDYRSTWYVTLETRGTKAGGLSFARRATPDRGNVEGWIVRCLVGRWAEQKFRDDTGFGGSTPQQRHTVRKMVEDGAENDYVLAKDYAVHSGIATESDFASTFAAPFWIDRDRRAQEFVRSRWREIERVVEGLMDRRTLDRANVRQILGCASTRIRAAFWLSGPARAFRRLIAR